jgi:hypothetical protein
VCFLVHDFVRLNYSGLAVSLGETQKLPSPQKLGFSPFRWRRRRRFFISGE